MKRGGVKAEPEGACSRCTGGGQDWKGRAEMETRCVHVCVYVCVHAHALMYVEG